MALKFSLSLKSAFALVGMAAFAHLVVDFDMRIISLLLCVIFVIINLLGVKGAGRIQSILVFCLLSVLLAYIIRGFGSVNVQYFQPFITKGWRSIFATAGFVFVSYGGLLKVCSVAEETKDPARTIPKGMIISITLVTIFYIAVVFVTSGILGSLQLDKSLTPISDGAQVIMGSRGRVILSIAAMLAFITTANAGILAASRYPLALARDGLLPKGLAKVNRRFNTPHISILITGIFMILMMLLKLDILVKTASTVLILTYLFSCLSVIIMRESHLQNYQPRFHAPLYPWMQLVGIIGFLFLLVQIGQDTLLVSPSLIVAAIFVYWYYGRIRTTREFALLRLIERVTAKEFTKHLLESELKDIIRERDRIVKDRFDRLIEKAIVLNVDKMNVNDFFKLMAKEISAKLKIDFSVILDLLQAREKESSTAISPTLAIPHIVVEGKDIFDIFLVCSKTGIYFSKDAPSVHAIFVLVGTRDERNFHLRALAAIA